MAAANPRVSVTSSVSREPSTAGRRHPVSTAEKRAQNRQTANPSPTSGPTANKSGTGEIQVGSVARSTPNRHGEQKQLSDPVERYLSPALKAAAAARERAARIRAATAAQVASAKPVDGRPKPQERPPEPVAVLERAALLSEPSPSLPPAPGLSVAEAAQASKIRFRPLPRHPAAFAAWVPVYKPAVVAFRPIRSQETHSAAQNADVEAASVTMPAPDVSDDEAKTKIRKPKGDTTEETRAGVPGSQADVMGEAKAEIRQSDADAPEATTDATVAKADSSREDADQRETAPEPAQSGASSETKAVAIPHPKGKSARATRVLPRREGLFRAVPPTEPLPTEALKHSLRISETGSATDDRFGRTLEALAKRKEQRQEGNEPWAEMVPASARPLAAGRSDNRVRRWQFWRRSEDDAV